MRLFTNFWHFIAILSAFLVANTISIVFQRYERNLILLSIVQYCIEWILHCAAFRWLYRTVVG